MGGPLEEGVILARSAGLNAGLDYIRRCLGEGFCAEASEWHACASCWRRLQFVWRLVCIYRVGAIEKERKIQSGRKTEEPSLQSATVCFRFITIVIGLLLWCLAGDVFQILEIVGVVFEFALQRTPADSQNFGGMCPVSLRSFQHRVDMIAFDLRQGFERVR